MVSAAVQIEEAGAGRGSVLKRPRVLLSTVVLECK